jgi:hypothetical protein
MTDFVPTAKARLCLTDTLVTRIVGATGVLQEVVLIDTGYTQDRVRSFHVAFQATGGIKQGSFLR